MLKMWDCKCGAVDIAPKLSTGRLPSSPWSPVSMPHREVSQVRKPLQSKIPIPRDFLSLAIPVNLLIGSLAPRLTQAKSQNTLSLRNFWGRESIKSCILCPLIATGDLISGTEFT